MQETILLALSAFWIGILTAISPCPLATNIAAVSFVAYRVSHRGVVLLAGILYTLGRSTAYVALSSLIVNAAVNVPLLSEFLQRYINKLLGILLIVVGMVLLDLISLKLPRFAPSEQMQQRFDKAGVAGAFLMGVLFALAFCPVSAALFFGSLVPLALKARSSVGLPLIYGTGTALPVLVFAVLVAAGAACLNRVYERVAKLELYAKRATGGILIAVGIYYVLVYVFGVI
jgi:cytochrome c biogenesis protein CcdA